jgi:hypothetical protein
MTLGLRHSSRRHRCKRDSGTTVSSLEGNQWTLLAAVEEGVRTSPACANTISFAAKYVASAGSSAAKPEAGW